MLDLVADDAELTRAAHRRRNLPELAEIDEAERDLQAKRDDLVVAQTSAGDLEREVKRLEGEVEQIRAREQRDRERMEAGGSAKQMADLDSELQTLSRRQGVLEDELLDVMEQREALDTNVSKAREAVDAAEERLADAQRRRDEAFTDLDAAESRYREDRDSIVAELPEDLLAVYDRVRAQRGVGAGALQGSRCEACRLELDRAALVEVREAAADDVVRCAECGAILVRTGGSGR
nr:C4-type zinc ribbon domain-containing protein [Saccharopolyspora sp. HNM0983]